MHRSYYILLFILMLLMQTGRVNAQLPECNSNRIYMVHSGSGYYQFDPTLPVVPGTNPQLIIPPLPNATPSLAVGRALNTTNPGLVFYVVMLGGEYRYYNGTTWINTNHSAGSQFAYNPGMGRRYIFNLDGSAGHVTRYDGTGDAIILTTVPPQLLLDIAADSLDNFYLLKASAPQALLKYSYCGVLLNSFTITGVPNLTSGNGLAIHGNDVYFYAGGSANYFHGVISGNNVHFTQSPPPVVNALDFASCANGAPFQQPVDQVVVCVDDLPYIWNGQSYTAEGIYSLNVTGSNGCDSTVMLNLVVTPAISLDLGADTVICDGTVLDLNSNVTGANHLWQDGSSNPVYRVTNAGNYWLTVTVNGCSASDTIRVDYDDCDCIPKIPNAFSPNGDGINDRWIIPYVNCISKLQVSVYNRYGSLVFHSDNYQNDWNGNYKSGPCPDGTYYYVVRPLQLNRRWPVYRGNVTLIR